MLQRGFKPFQFWLSASEIVQMHRYKFSSRKPTQEEQPEQQQRTTQADESNPNLEQKEQAFSYLRLGWRILLWSSLGLFSYNMYLNNSSEQPSSQLGHVKLFADSASYWQKQYQDFYDFFTKPPVDKLLPDIPPLPPGYEIPKTLVLNLTGTLVRTDFIFGKGAEIMKRPGLTKFLKKLSTLYEVVVLTDDETMFTQTICEKLDPQHQIFAGRFGRESMVLDRNQYYKDLKYLNRPLNRLIVVDSKLPRLSRCYDNSIVLNEFEGSPDDHTLAELLPLLEYLAKPEVKDIRAELRKYGNENPQSKYREELKLREIQMTNNMKKGMLGMIDSMAQQKRSGPRYVDHQRRL